MTAAKLGVAGLALAVTLLGCGPTLTPDPPPVHPPEGACAAAERHMRELRCPEADAGGGFGGLCERSAARAVDLHPGCIIHITTCADVDAASRGAKC